jgi:hypothetical protein
MPGYLLESMFVKGYKSFGEIELCLAPINVLIGASRAGKSKKSPARQPPGVDGASHGVKNPYSMLCYSFYR